MKFGFIYKILAASVAFILYFLDTDWILFSINMNYNVGLLQNCYKNTLLALCMVWYTLMTR